MTSSAIKSAVDALIANLPSPQSKRAYAADWTRYALWLELEGVLIEEAKPRHVEAHLTWLRDDKKLKKATIGRALSVLREVYGRLVRDEVMAVNPAREVKAPRAYSKPKVPVMDEEQVRALFELSTSTWKERRERACISLLFGLGWRREEIAQLSVEDFDGTTVTMMVKGGKPLTVGVPEWLLEELAEWRRYANIETGAILPRSIENRRHVSGDIVYNIVQAAAHRAKLPKFSPHSLRRTNITIGGDRGTSLKDRQLSVGHASQATTERYDKSNKAAKNAPGQIFKDLVRRNKKEK